MFPGGDLIHGQNQQRIQMMRAILSVPHDHPAFRRNGNEILVPNSKNSAVRHFEVERLERHRFEQLSQLLDRRAARLTGRSKLSSGGCLGRGASSIRCKRRLAWPSWSPSPLGGERGIARIVTVPPRCKKLRCAASGGRRVSRKPDLGREPWVATGMKKPRPCVQGRGCERETDYLRRRKINRPAAPRPASTNVEGSGTV